MPGVAYRMFINPSMPLEGNGSYHLIFRGIGSLNHKVRSSRGYCSGKFPAEFTHLDRKGKAKMVDVSGKMITKREAVATCQVHLGEKVFDAVKKSEVKKGNVFEVARLAGINAAKQTCFLIPLCHNILLSSVSVDFEMDENQHCVTVVAKVTSTGQTGVEMEALTTVTLSALTIYDMCKSLSHHMTIGNVKLMKKTGGKSSFLYEDSL